MNVSSSKKFDKGFFILITKQFIEQFTTQFNKRIQKPPGK